MCLQGAPSDIGSPRALTFRQPIPPADERDHVPRKPVHRPKVLPLRAVQILSPHWDPGDLLQVVEKPLRLGLEGGTPAQLIGHLSHMNAGKHRAR